MTPAVYSVSGLELSVKDATNEQLAECLETEQENKKLCEERIALLGRELAKRMGTKKRAYAGAYNVIVREYVKVERARLDA